MNSKMKGSEFLEMRDVKFLNLKCHLTFYEKDSTIKKYFLPISRDSSYDAIFRCPESYSLDIKIFAFLKKNVIRLHASVFFLIVAININKSQQAISDLAIHFMSFLATSFCINTNNGLPVKLHPNIPNKYLANLVEMGQY